jgi:hypothetical protein
VTPSRTDSSCHGFRFGSGGGGGVGDEERVVTEPRTVRTMARGGVGAAAAQGGRFLSAMIEVRVRVAWGGGGDDLRRL